MVEPPPIPPPPILFPPSLRILEVGIPPPNGGSIFRVVEFQPEGSMAASDNTESEGLTNMGATTPDGARHPGMHRTESIDYAVIMSGEIDMNLDGGSAHLKQGDVLVQRGTIHNWVNNGTEPCVIAFILIDAITVDAGGGTLAATG